MRASLLAKRTIVVLMTCTLGYLAFAHSLAMVTAQNAPALALTWDAGNPEARTYWADYLLLDQATEKNVRRAAESAKQSLGALAINAKALRILAVAAANKGQHAEYLALLGVSARMSRRELGTQLLLIETAVAQDDVQGALVHFDTALRIDDQQEAFLFPILSDAMTDRSLFPHIAALVTRRPPWLGHFIDWNIFEGKYFAEFSRILVRMPDVARRLGEDRRRLLLYRLAQGGHGEIARQLLVALGAGAPITDAVDDDFADLGQQPPFDWDFPPAVRGEIGRESDDGAIVFEAEDAAGPALLRVMMLRPGRYRFNADMRAEGDVSSPPLWTVGCGLAAERPLMSLPVPATGQAFVRRSSEFTIPPGCALQAVQLLAARPDSTSDAVFAVKRVTISPVAR